MGLKQRNLYLLEAGYSAFDGKFTRERQDGKEFFSEYMLTVRPVKSDRVPSINCWETGWYRGRFIPSVPAFATAKGRTVFIFYRSIHFFYFKMEG